jgi:hypothetical protein
VAEKKNALASAHAQSLIAPSLNSSRLFVVCCNLAEIDRAPETFSSSLPFLRRLSSRITRILSLPLAHVEHILCSAHQTPVSSSSVFATTRLRRIAHKGRFFGFRCLF